MAQVPLLDVNFGLGSTQKSYGGKKVPHGFHSYTEEEESHISNSIPLKSYGGKKVPHGFHSYTDEEEPHINCNTIPQKSYGGKKAPHGFHTYTDEEETLPISNSNSQKSYGGKRAPSGLTAVNVDEDSKLACVKKSTLSNIIVLNNDEESASYKSYGLKKIIPTNSLVNHDGEEKPQIASQAGRRANVPLTEIKEEGQVDNDKVTFPQQGSKRGAPGPLVTSSDEEESLPPSPRSSVNSSSSIQHAYEHDHDYEPAASPSGSSTASGPVYIRPPGFKHHAQEIKKVKKKKTTVFDFKSALKKRAPTPPKVRPKRESVPMRLRALPQSFWKQPNVPNPVSPAPLFPSLPPLGSKDSNEDITDMRPITPPDDKERHKKQSRQPERKVYITGDTDLLLKHLFERAAEDKKNSSQIKRGRPRKMAVPRETGTKALISGDDPYLVDAVTQKLFPQLSLESRQGQVGSTTLQLVTLRDGDKSVTLPSLSIEQNYSQMLSDLAMNI
ncbi:uncharacterized protein LOC133205681 [Saccostrea echinata]|uniref:uncharacterized protein LOC133205681 n=1 Tax=Saccostrea echinata TaxID=191078 RepID=UPI002A82E0E6|nr:uncharacterized protein LOC133205681 [Saccostrea echinata]XP_061197518.1 uncharacterized protein LOC133205681 [Saccostrea echinata]